MSEQPNKPRDIKDLRARLGRTQTSAQEGLPPPVAPPAGGVPAPLVPPGPAATNIAGKHGGVVPPFGTPVAPPFGSATKPTDPFAAKGNVQAQEVRLVMDERPVEDSEIGRQSKQRMYVGIFVTAVVALAAGWGFGSMMADRRLWNTVIADGRDIYQSVEKARPIVEKAQHALDQALENASPPPGKTPVVDFESLKTLKALPKPFDAGVFSRKHYKAFNPGTVDSLFEYYNSVNLIWDKTMVLVSRTEQNRAEIERAAKAASELATTQYGCVPIQAGDSIACGLSVVTIPPGEGELPTKLQVAPRSGAHGVEKSRYQGQDLKSNPGDYVILVDTRASLGVLGSQAGAFATYRKELVELKKLMDHAMELQGTLIKELGKIKSLGGVSSL